MSEKKREILFRGKKNPSGEWIEGFLVGNCHIGDWVAATPVHSKTVGQFTGLYDSTKWEALTDGEKMDFYKHHYIGEDGMSVRFQDVDDVKHLWKGKKIFEGDILSENGYLFVVVWNQPWAEFRLQHDGYKYPEWNRGVQMEIVGNIHDNPELLKEATDV